MKLNRKNKKGFTIVELVIVIGVIGILSAILIPTFANLTTEAQKAARKQQASDAYTAYLVEATDNKFDGLFTRIGDSAPYTYEVADVDIAQKSQAEVALLIGTDEWYLYTDKGWEKQDDSYVAPTVKVVVDAGTFYKKTGETTYSTEGYDATALSTFNGVVVYVK